jgi:hypothetical protein
MRCTPVVRQQVVELRDWRRRQARQHILQVCPRLDSEALATGREAEQHGRRLATAAVEQGPA